MSPDYVNEVLIRLRAKADWEKVARRRAERRARLGKKAGRARRGVSTEVMDADASEIE